MLFVEIDKAILKFTWKCKGLRIGKTTLEKKNKVVKLTLTNFKFYYYKTIIAQCCTGIKINI